MGTHSITVSNTTGIGKIKSTKGVYWKILTDWNKRRPIGSKCKRKLSGNETKFCLAIVG